MRCKSCEYRLWSLSSRQCPECGTPFKPSDFEFAPSAVRFHCPHCSQAYYGTSAKGHLEPIEFDCARCGRHVHMDEMVLSPAEGVDEERAVRDVAPWLDRGKRGFVRAWFSTVGMAMVSPGKLMRLVPDRTAYEAGWGFALLTTMLTLLLTILPWVFFANLGSGFGPLAGRLAIGMFVIASVGTIASGIFITLWAAVAHGILRLTGHVPFDLGGTAKAICYSSGAGILTAVPCIGMYLGWIWPVVSAAVMVKQAQRVSGWRAAAAVLTLPATIIFILVVAYAVLMASMFTTFSANMSGMEQTRYIAAALVNYADRRDGRGPPHAIMLVTGGAIHGEDLVAGASDTWTSDVPVSDVTLEDFDVLSDARRAAVAQAAVDALPDDVAAHRLGDFVFTYHGIGDLRAAPPELWIVMCAFDPDTNETSAGDGTLWVGQVDGNIKPVPVLALSNELARQNALRATLRLPPLPHPSAVRHGQPARGR